MSKLKLSLLDLDGIRYHRDISPVQNPTSINLLMTPTHITITHLGTKALLLPMLRDAMSFSHRTDPQVRAMEKQIDDLSWGFELILESTDGDRNHENRSDRLATLAKTLDHALSDNGIVYIPAFALGRTQELIYELGRINPRVPVFIDSLLGIRICQ